MSRSHRLRCLRHLLEDLVDDVVGGDAFGFGFEVERELVAHGVSGFGFVTKC